MLKQFHHHSLAILLLCVTSARGQGTRADYERATHRAERFAGLVTHDRVEPHWISADHFWYAANLGEGRTEYRFVDAAKGEQRVAFDHAALAKKLSAETKNQVDAERLELKWLRPANDGAKWLLEFQDRTYRYDPNTHEVARVEESNIATELPAWQPGPPWRRMRGTLPSEKSPDGKWRVIARGGELWAKNLADDKEYALGKVLQDGAYFEGRVWWAPDSTNVVALETMPGDNRRVTLIESSPADQLQPKVKSFGYDKPGDKLPVSRPRLFRIGDRQEVPVDNKLFANPWSLDQLRWENDSRSFTFLYNQRGHQVLRWIQVQEDGAAHAVIEETSPTFIDYAHKLLLHPLPETDEAIWMSERDGWNHLYLYDTEQNAVKNQLTRGPWVVRSVLWVDDDQRQVWFEASGIDAEQDPYYLHTCRVNFDGSGFTQLTAGDGTHEVQFSPDRKWVIDKHSRVDQAPRFTLRRGDTGAHVLELEQADDSALRAAGWQAPERFVAKARDGRTDIYGVLYKPTNFDPAKKYPVIEELYAGPQGAFVPKSFAAQHGPEALAELGFIVAQIDGLGTSHRSKAFHDVCYKNLADAGLPDRKLWLKAAAENRPWMDLSRVGVRGTSAGGQSALGALLWHGDFYTVGVSNCGCHDNRMDKVWWNELWMGWPVGPHYAEQSNVTNSHRLAGKLLLIVGETDTNVDPASTMQVVNALVKANKDFDLLVVPSAGHGAASAYTQRRTWDFFVRHLLKVEPRSDK